MHLLAEAVDVAKSAFEAALYDLQSLGEEQLKDALRVMQLLRDNYTLWDIDIKAIIVRKKQAGYVLLGEDSNEDDDNEDRIMKKEEVNAMEQDIQKQQMLELIE